MKLEILIGKDYSADFTVVSDDGITGQVLDPTDSATFSLSSTGPVPVQIIAPIIMTITDIDNGRFNVLIPAAITATLSQDIGFKEDKYPTVSNYVGILDFTLASGNRHATVDMYARNIGI